MNLLEAILAAKLNGGGGGGDVTAAAVLAAMQGMTNVQSAAALNAIGGEPKKVKVTFTNNNDVYSADKTIAEIYAAYTGGQIVEGVLWSEIFAASYISNVAVILTGAYVDTNGKPGITTLIGINSGGSDGWTHYDKILEPAVADVAVSGATPTITPVANSRYLCGELTSLTISDPPASGAYSIVFTSGATATVLTTPAGLVMPDDFTVEANTRYEINVSDGYALCAGWAVSAS